MNQQRRLSVTRPLAAPHANVQPMQPDPSAHAEILVGTYGLQTAAWIAETNQATARPADTPYWSRVLHAVGELRTQQQHAS